MNNIWLLSIVSLINDFSSKMILPVLPLYIKQLGGAGLAIGLISGIGESIASLLKVFSGYWSDKAGRRKPFVLGGYALSSVSKFLFYFASSWPIILVLRSFERAGKGLRSASRDAMLASTSEKKKRGKTFGIHRAFDSGGAVLGSIAALLLIWLLGFTIRNVFLAAGIIAFFSLLPIFFTRETGSQKKAAKMRFIVSFKSLSKRLKLFMAVATIFAFGNFSYMFFVIRSQEILDGGDVLIIPILLYILYNLFYTIMAVPSGMLADRMGKDKVLLMGYSLFIPVTAGFILFDSISAFIALFIVYGIMYAFIESNERAYVSDLAEGNVRGTALGTFFTLTSIAALPAGIIAGLLYDVLPAYAFAYGGAAAAISSVLMLVHIKANSKSN
ncbi:MFS transporter [Candidatus Woesearchaeota archaeon]|nr:MFS transporter [Candidatus Woesearchaeota archaeon]